VQRESTSAFEIINEATTAMTTSVVKWSGSLTTHPEFLRSRDLTGGPLSLVSTNIELLERKSRDFGIENREYGRRDSSR
jgi:hypothetical protein